MAARRPRCKQIVACSRCARGLMLLVGAVVALFLVQFQAGGMLYVIFAGDPRHEYLGRVCAIPPRTCRSTEFSRYGKWCFVNPLVEKLHTPAWRCRGEYGCACFTQYDSQFRMATQWEWIEDSACRARAWDGNAFCSTLGSRTLYLIGDSLMGQLSESMKMLTILPCRDQIVFNRSVKLIPHDVPISFAELNPSPQSIVLVNAGAHIKYGDGEDIADVVTYVKRHSKPNTTLIWWSGVFGHHIHTLLPIRTEDEYAQATRDALFKMHFEYSEQLKQQERAQLHCSLHGIPFLNSMATMYRSDAHTCHMGDDLHYSQPGVFLFVMRQLHQLMVELR